MTNIAPAETTLIAEVEDLRIRFPDTKDLYREVAILLFFRHGQTPTTNRLYQLVRKGSMNTVTAALSAFWETLRQRSRVQIDNPAIPEGLKTAAGDLIQVLWENANVAANAEFEAAKIETAETVRAAKGTLEATETAFKLTQAENAALGEKLRDKTDENQALLAEIDTAKRAHGATAARLEESRAEVESLRSALGDARRDFAAEMDKARGAMKLAEERLDAAERRALAEIDRERTLRADTAKDANRLRAEIAAAEASFQTRAQAYATESGQLSGKLSGAEAELAKREEDIGKLRKEVSVLETVVARSEGEITAVRSQKLSLEEAMKWSTPFNEQAAAQVALRTFNNIAVLWKLTEHESMAILGTTSISQTHDWNQSIKPIPQDVVIRISLVLGIYKNLGVLFSDDAVAGGWVRRKNKGKLFGGRSAIELMLADKDGLKHVREYLDAETTGGN